ncbi:MAG: sigma-70 family RNA polymerase sigma factor [Planctomycetota bacterium]
MSETTSRRSRAERDELVESNLALVGYVVSRMPRPVHEVLDREDLLAAGSLGLIRAAEQFDEGRGTSFSTLAYRTISSAVLDELRRLDPMSRGHRARMRAFRRAGEQLREILGRTPTNLEIADHLNIALAELERDLESSRHCKPVRLDNDFVLQPVREPADPGPGPDEAAADSDELVALRAAIAKLPDRERRIVALYVQDGLFLREIGDLLGITESRVSQLLSRAMKRLRDLLDTGGRKR